jgi:pilus assembly protein Flp/PilA
MADLKDQLGAAATEYALPVALLENQLGASAAEYALILGIIGAAIALAAIGLGVSITNSIQRADNTIVTCGGGC